jgi:hypothetical protein
MNTAAPAASADNVLFIRVAPIADPETWMRATDPSVPFRQYASSERISARVKKIPCDVRVARNRR